MRSIYRIAALRTSPLPKPSQLPSCLHCPVRQRLTYSPNTLRLSLLRPPPPRQTTSDVLPSQPASLTFCSIKNRHPFPNDDFSTSILFSTDLPTIILSAVKERKILFSFSFPIKYNNYRKTANCNQDPGNYIGGITSLHNIDYFPDMVRYIRFRWCWFR